MSTRAPHGPSVQQQAPVTIIPSDVRKLSSINQQAVYGTLKIGVRMRQLLGVWRISHTIQISPHTFVNQRGIGKESEAARGMWVQAGVCLILYSISNRCPQPLKGQLFQLSLGGRSPVLDYARCNFEQICHAEDMQIMVFALF